MSVEENQKRVGKPALAVAIVLMALPPVIPLYYALSEEDTMIRGVFIGTGVVMLIANGLMVALIHRWLNRMDA